MGVSLAASAINSGNVALWASEGRSDQTRARAEEHGLTEVDGLEDLCEQSKVIVCVCPPHAAEDVADSVSVCAFKGIYLDANAISPQRSALVSRRVEAGRASFVDGGIIGGPAWKPDSTWLYLSGERAEEAAACFSAGPLGTEVIGTEPGKASALKMCFAANTKGTTALMCAVLAAAENLGVRHELEAQWSRGGSEMVDRAHNSAQSATSKAWRFEGEMAEIAATFESAGVPGGFHQAAGEIYRRLAAFKDAPERPDIQAVLDALLGRD
jgi:3-hydroxyisobutyrate dehydrogenase-like beta-hydroxyacid dehydrogenase